MSTQNYQELSQHEDVVQQDPNQTQETKITMDSQSNSNKNPFNPFSCCCSTIILCCYCALIISIPLSIGIVRIVYNRPPNGCVPNITVQLGATYYFNFDLVTNRFRVINSQTQAVVSYVQARASTIQYTLDIVASNGQAHASVYQRMLTLNPTFDIYVGRIYGPLYLLILLTTIRLVGMQVCKPPLHMISNFLN